MASLASPIVLLDLLVVRVWQRPSTGLTWERGRHIAWPRVLVKLAGLALTLGVLTLAYWALPEYERSLYEPFFSLVSRYGPLARGVVVPG